MAVFLLIGKTSALTMNIAGVVKDWLLIGVSVVLFKCVLTFVTTKQNALLYFAISMHLRKTNLSPTSSAVHAFGTVYSIHPGL